MVADFNYNLLFDCVKELVKLVGDDDLVHLSEKWHVNVEDFFILVLPDGDFQFNANGLELDVDINLLQQLIIIVKHWMNKMEVKFNNVMILKNILKIEFFFL